MPLPEAPSFFWGRTIQGEVYVKGLGEDRTQAVRSLCVPFHSSHCALQAVQCYIPKSCQSAVPGAAGKSGGLRLRVEQQ